MFDGFFCTQISQCGQILNELLFCLGFVFHS
jgi:hypothetical protein